MAQAAKQRFHNYVMNFTLAASAGAVATDNFQVDKGWDFYWTKAELYAYSGTTPTKTPLITANLQEGGSKIAISDNAIPIAAVFGSGEIPFILPTPHLIGSGSTFYATLTNLAAVAYEVYLVFSGIHRWRG